MLQRCRRYSPLFLPPVSYCRLSISVAKARRSKLLYRPPERRKPTPAHPPPHSNSNTETSTFTLKQGRPPARLPPLSPPPKQARIFIRSFAFLSPPSKSRMSAAEQDAAATATVNADDDKDVEAELFGEDDDDDKAEATEDKATSTAPADPAADPAAANATAPAPTDPKAEEAAPPATSSFSIPKKDAATASTASTPALTSPAKHSSDGNGDASPRKKLSDGGGGDDSDGPQLPDELVVPDSAKQIIADDRSNRLKALLLKVCIMVECIIHFILLI